MGASTARTTWGRKASRGAAAGVAEALLAAGDQMESTYELTQGGPTLRAFWKASLAAGHKWSYQAEWPCEAVLEDHGRVIARDDHGGVFALEGGAIVYVQIGHGWLGMTVSVPERDQAEGVFAAFSQRYPPLYREQADNAGLIPVTFWTLGRFGPQSRMRMIESATWDAIAGNYSVEIRDELAAMMRDFEPGKSGQLVLWQGPPGTGKTWALRALASEWRSWCEFHYITDPDAFFVKDPSYMIDVLLADTYDELVVLEQDGDPEVVSSNRRDGKWRVLILEDTGELLSANAKEQYGQGLSRVLNVVDGMVGQGLRVLLLLTTNDELGDLHPAVKRPGRCAQALEFGPLSVAEANDWLYAFDPEVDPVEEPMTVAELFHHAGLVGTDALATEEEQVEALVREGAKHMVREEDLAASLAWQADAWRDVRRDSFSSDTAAEVARVAEAHQPDEPAYGQAYWNAGTRTVYWVDWDGTSVEEHDAAYADFLAIEGVEHVEGCAECAAPEGDGWEQVYALDNAEALRAVLSMASAPLTEPSREQPDGPEAPGGAASDASTPTADLSSALAELAASGDLENEAAVTRAVLAVADIHRMSLDAIRETLTASAAKRGSDRGDLLAFAALDALKELAHRPDPASPDVHVDVHVPKHDLSVHVDGPTVEAPPPADVHVDVHVPPQEAPHVTVEQAPAAPAPVQVDVHVPPAEPQPPAVVHVHPAQPAEPRARSVVVDVDEEGRRRFVVEDD